MNKESLLKWAQNALDYYNSVAPELILSFYYQFQKPADFDKECELLIMGINPGYNPKFYNEEKKYWETPTPAGMPRIENGRITLPGFLAGNPGWECAWKEVAWPILKGMSLIGLGKDRLDRIQNWQYINYIPFPSRSTTTFHSKVKKKTETEVRDHCVGYTKNLISLLSPKRIIVLGTSNGFDRLKEKKDCKVLLRGRYRYIITSRICGIPSLAVPHPSWPWPAKAREEMKRMIDLYLQGRENEIESIEIKEDIHHHIPSAACRKIKEAVIFRLKERGMSDIYSDVKTCRFHFGENLELTISESTGGFIGIRHYSYNGKRITNHNYQRNGVDSEEVKAIRGILSGYGFDTSKDVWLGRKPFSDYGTDCSAVTTAIMQEMETIEKLICRFAL